MKMIYKGIEYEVSVIRVCGSENIRYRATSNEKPQEQNEKARVRTLESRTVTSDTCFSEAMELSLCTRGYGLERTKILKMTEATSPTPWRYYVMSYWDGSQNNLMVYEVSAKERKNDEIRGAIIIFFACIGLYIIYRVFS